MQLVEAQSFTGLADQRFVSQATISMQIKELERAAGAPLLVRSRGRFAVTEAGQLLFRHAKGILGQVEDMESAIASKVQPNGATTVLTIGANSSWRYVLPELIASFRLRNPGARVILKVTGELGLTIQALEEGSIDLAPVTHVSAAVLKRFEVWPAGEEEFVIIAPPSHELSKRARVAASDLHGSQFITVSNLGSPYLHSLGIRRDAISEFDTWDAAKAAVRAGTGLALVSELSVRPELQCGIFSRIRPDARPFRRPLYVLRKGSAPVSEVQRSFIQHVIAREKARAAGP